MRQKKSAAIILALIISSATIFVFAQGFNETVAGISLKPYRVLVVIDIDFQGNPQSYVDSSDWAFHDIATLLKLWSVPFDVLRLDQNTLSTSDFLDGQGNVKYGVIIWNCNPWVLPAGSQDWKIIATAVQDYGISLISLANTFGNTVIRDLLGINYVNTEWARIKDPFNITVDHYITRGMEGMSIPAGDGDQEGTIGGYGCQIGFDTSKATVLATQGNWPQLSVRDLSDATKTVWIGGNRDVEFHLSPVMANILRNSIAYCMGYLITKTYPNTVMLRMDDPGGSSGAYLQSYHYPQLTQDQIGASIIQPLQIHNATLAVMYVPGYPRNIEESTLKSWTLDWVDPFGTRQNLTSNYLGILEGMGKGVLEVQSHGWTHIAPNLTDWWNNSTEWANVDWYREFYDARHNQEVDAATQNQHLNMSIQWIQEAFGTWPLSFVPGGFLISGLPSPGNVPANYTHKLAALQGFGLAIEGNGYYYLGTDMVLASMKMTRTYNLSKTSEIRQRLKTGWDVPVGVFFHDKDIADNPDYLFSYLYALEAPGSTTEDPVQHYLSQDEFIAYMHSQVSTTNLKFTFEYDNHYCKRFSNYSSSWTLQLTDDLLTKLRDMGKISITTDNNTVTADSATYFNSTMTLNVPQGTGTHEIQFGLWTSEPTYISVSLDNSTVTLGSKVTVTGTLLNINRTGIGNAAIILSYGFQGYRQPLTWTLTNPQGNFSISWIPQASGQFTVEVDWKGNETYEAASNSTVLTVTP
jgi:hypothetical protein